MNNDYTIQFETKIYQIARQDICTGLRGADVRVEQRRDGSVAVRFTVTGISAWGDAISGPRWRLPSRAEAKPPRQPVTEKRRGTRISI